MCYIAKMYSLSQRFLLSANDCEELDKHSFNGSYFVICVFLVIISGICSGLTLGKCGPSCSEAGINLPAHVRTNLSILRTGLLSLDIVVSTFSATRLNCLESGVS